MRDVCDLHSASGTATNMIDVQNLTYAVGNTTLLAIPNLQLASEGTTVVMGPNGAGKSLLLRLLHGLIQPTTGLINCEGSPLNDATRRRQALVFQKPVLLRRSVAGNIDFVLKTRRMPRERRDEMLRLVGLEAYADRPARRLSGGEQQRLAIARALATKPKILFMDEPTASLDPASVKAIEDIVNQTVAAGVRVIFVTHDIGQARRLADDVIFLANGKLIEQSPADVFFDHPTSEKARAYLAGKIDKLLET